MRAHLAEVRRRMRVIAASPLPARTGPLLSFHASIAHLEGEDAKAIELFRRALAFYKEHDTVGPAAAAHWRLGDLVGGDEGAALKEQSRAFYRSVGAARPERIVAFAFPGTAQ